jgi:hypothetical protein
VRALRRGGLIAAAVALAAAAPAHAQTAGSTPGVGALVVPRSYDTPPAGHRLAATKVIAIAERVPKVRAARRTYPRAYARAYLKGASDWQVSLYDPRRNSARREEVAQVLVDDRTGDVKEAWTGVQVAWPMARGYPGQFGRTVNAPYVWIGLSLLFVLPFLRPPLRLLHLDLAVLLAFGISYAFFNDANLGVSVPSAYPLLAYLLVRMLFAARRRPAAPRLLVGPDFLLLAIVFLVGFRIALNVTNGNVIDVGYAGVIGADRITGPGPLYGAFPFDNPHGDTYGPVTYAAYVPFELVFPWSGTWDSLPAAHAAALAFDLGCAALLWLLGRRLRGPLLGLLLAYLWLSFPFTVMVENSGANDALVALLVLAALLAAARPFARGALIGLAGLTKFAPLALAPLFARRGVVKAALGFAFAVIVVLAPFAPELSLVYRRTLGFQGSRDSPFSIWGGHGALQAIAQAAAVVLAIGVAFVPRRRDVATLAALAAAVLIAVQMTVNHWFYLYLVWFAPLVFVALLTPEPGAAPARSSPPAAAPSNGSGPR